MELRHLRYFDALAEALNFTRAAQRLHVTQSTLSHQIRQLEDELGYPLFDRTTKKVAMTEAGEVLRSHMVPALQQIDRGVQALRDAPPTLQGSIRLGTTHSFNTRLVPQCVSTFLGVAPTTHVSVAELSARNIVRGLTSAKLDLGVSYQFQEGALRGLSLWAGADNISDQQPPIFPTWQQANTDPTQYDVLGRRYYVRLTYAIK